MQTRAASEAEFWKGEQPRRSRELALLSVLKQSTEAHVRVVEVEKRRWTDGQEREPVPWPGSTKQAPHFGLGPIARPSDRRWPSWPGQAASGRRRAAWFGSPIQSFLKSYVHRPLRPASRLVGIRSTFAPSRAQFWSGRRGESAGREGRKLCRYGQGRAQAGRADRRRWACEEAENEPWTKGGRWCGVMECGRGLRVVKNFETQRTSQAHSPARSRPSNSALTFPLALPSQLVPFQDDRWRSRKQITTWTVICSSVC